MVSMSQYLVSKLVELGAIQFDFEDGFVYASGKKGPVYCDTRKIIGDPLIRNIFVDALVEKVKQLGKADAFGAMATGAISLGALVADRLNLPFFYVRSSTKEYGKNNQIEGLNENGFGDKKVILFEDLINSGGSVLKGANALKSAGFTLTNILSLVDYNFSNANEALRSICPVNSNQI